MTEPGRERPTFRILLLFLFHPISAWGPYTHQYLAATNEDLPSSSTASSPFFLTGSSAPDAFKFLHPRFHTLDFAKDLYDAAHNRTFETKEFALGWGCHLAHDYIGHHPNGFLNPREDHPLELATDTFVFHQHRVPFEPITDAERNFVIDVAHRLGLAIGVTNARKAVKKFQQMTVSERRVMEVNFWYEAEMKRFSFCNVSKGFDAVLKNLDVAMDWCRKVCTKWRVLMEEGGEDDPIVGVSRLVRELFEGNGGSGCVSSQTAD